MRPFSLTAVLLALNINAGPASASIDGMQRETQLQASKLLKSSNADTNDAIVTGPRLTNGGDDMEEEGDGYDEVGPGLIFTTNLEEEQYLEDVEQENVTLERMRQRLLKGRGERKRAQKKKGRQSSPELDDGGNGTGSDEISSGLTFNTEEATTDQPTRPPSGVWEETDIMTTTTDATSTLLPFTTTVLPPDADDNDESLLQEIQQVIDDTTYDSDVCSCSPREYTIRLALGQLCQIDDLQDNGGIGATFCLINIHDPDDEGESEDILQRHRELAHNQNHYYGEGHGNEENSTKSRILQQNNLPKHQINKLQIIDVQFVEFALDANLTVLNQDNTYTNVSLSNGDKVSFSSISKELGTGVQPMSSYIPGGVQINIRGLIGIESEDKATGMMVMEEKIVSQHVTWSYTNACDALPVMNGNRIGWINFERLQHASVDFCPVAPLTPSPSLSPTPAPQKEIIFTKSSKAHFASKTSKQEKSQTLFAKGSKVHAQSKTESMEKENVQTTDHMAKVYKEHSKSSKMSKALSMPSSKEGSDSDAVVSGKSSKVLQSKVVQDKKQSTKSSKGIGGKASSSSSHTHEMDVMDAKAKKVSSTAKASKR